MSEPTYNFVKGQGWIVQSFWSFETTTPDGKCILVEHRKPSIGECFGLQHTILWSKEDWFNYYKNLHSAYIRKVGNDSLINVPGYDWVTVTFV